MSLQSHALRDAVGEQEGFTLTEALVVVAILGILAALAAPHFTPLIERWRVRQVAHELRSSMMLARAEAVRRGGRVVVTRRSPSPDSCPWISANTQARHWDCGWQSFVDLNSNDRLDTGEELLAVSATPRGVLIERSSNLDAIRLDRWGETAAGIGFTVRPSREGAVAISAVCIASAGRIAIRSDEAKC